MEFIAKTLSSHIESPSTDTITLIHPTFRNRDNHSGHRAALFSIMTALSSLLGLLFLPITAAILSTISFAIVSAAYWYHDAILAERLIKKIEKQLILKESKISYSNEQPIDSFNSRRLKAYEKSFQKQPNAMIRDCIQQRITSNIQTSHSS